MSENLADRMPHLGEQYPGVRFVPVPMKGAELREEYLEAEAMFRSAMDEDLFDRIVDGAPKLSWVQIAAAGFDWMGGPALERRLGEGLQMTRSGNSFNAPIAEYAIGTMISMARQLPDYYRAQQEHRWARYVGRDFAGSTVGIFGTGAIGQEVAWRTTALRATALGVSRSGRPVDGFAEVHPSSSLAEVLPRCDFVVLAMPLTPETRHMFGAEQFAGMKPTAVVVNVGRGALIDDDALISALTSGQIAGAVLDAFVDEPLPADSPLWGTPNAVITPHTSFRTDGNDVRLCTDFCVNLDHFLAGRPLVGTMKEPALGY
ncbi:D-2-hydroxyacid dehydrogenase [Georgenia faecalis]|uniref:D-2-hydroxyacid dehydrogenase n=1 Tax=Georgenia faecalis TaxID=2483799 RepID=UPI0013E02B14|nr:D-2-hydroxyacid dehydrogenase [Georgenia faecalis]